MLGGSDLKILFLDIDGVILPFNPDTCGVPRKCAGRINALCREFDLKVVISSSWRADAIKETGNWRTAHEAKAWHAKYHWLYSVIGLDVDVIGVTPLLGLSHAVVPGVRGQEIKAWLAEHPEVTKWVAVDDFPQWLGQDILHRSVITEQQNTCFDDVALEEARKLFA